jgi:hypothetical protein
MKCSISVLQESHWLYMIICFVLFFLNIVINLSVNAFLSVQIVPAFQAVGLLLTQHLSFSAHILLSVE